MKNQPSVTARDPPDIHCKGDLYHKMNRINTKGIDI